MTQKIWSSFTPCETKRQGFGHPNRAPDFCEPPRNFFCTLHPGPSLTDPCWGGVGERHCGGRRRRSGKNVARSPRLGIEPRTSGLRVRCSTAWATGDLLGEGWYFFRFVCWETCRLRLKKCIAPTWTRTKIPGLVVRRSVDWAIGALATVVTVLPGFRCTSSCN